MSGRAPSPWGMDDRGRVVDAFGEPLLVTGVSLPTGNHPDAKRADANTDLLIAAPDLLAACKLADTAFRAYEQAGIVVPRVEALEKIRAAIARATRADR